MLAELRPRLPELVDALVEAVDPLGVLEEALGPEAGATAHVEDAVLGPDVELVEGLGAHVLGPDERVDPVVYLREEPVERPGTALVLEEAHRRGLVRRRARKARFAGPESPAGPPHFATPK